MNYDNSDQVYRENNLDYLLVHNPISEKAIEELKETEGVTKVETRNYLTMEVGGIKQSIAVFDEEGFAFELDRTGVVGDFSYDTVSREDGFLYAYSHFMEESGQKLGDELQGTLTSGSGESDYRGTAMGAFGSVSADYVITEATAKKLGLLDDSYAYLWVWCDEGAQEAVSEKLSRMFDEDEHVYWSSYAEEYALSEKTELLFKVFAYSFLALIGVICFLNMANTMIMNVITRRREFGILQAVGMSNGQLGKLLQLEGVFFTAGSILISLLIGLPAGYGAVTVSEEQGFFGLKAYHFPLAEICVMVAALLIMQMLLSFVLSRNVKKESIVERIRY